MCGFLGEYSFSDKLIEDEQFSSLLNMSKHRGPDDTHIEKIKNYRLGFNRLSILDLSINGRQPQTSPSRRFHLVFNGEIYNYRDLERYHNLKNLKSTSDTEVLVHLLDKIGVHDTISALNGMFAIMIIDSKLHKVYLARDFAGIKPLFYGLNKNGLVAASQFNQITKHPWFNGALSLRPESVKAYFGLGYMLAPDTVYDTIFQVKPGQLLEINQKAEIISTLFFDVNSKASTELQITSSIAKSVKQQLVSDVPLGSFLSGGIDSPLITALSNNYNDQINAFTLALEQSDLDESHQAKSYANHIDCRHHVVEVDTENLLSIVNDHFNYLHEPFGDYSSLPTYLVAKGATSFNTVMLSGDGGDELFFGYPRMLHVIKLRHWFKIPFVIRKPLARLAIKLNLLSSWAPYNHKTLSAFVMSKQSYIPEVKLKLFFKNEKYPDEVINLFEVDNAIDRKGLMKFLRKNEFYGHLQRVLIKVDRMSMANSLEVRVPFLDKHVVQNAFNWLPKCYTEPKDLKYLLKDMLRGFFPSSIINAKKKGFAVPIGEWLKGQLKGDVEKTVIQSSIYGNDILDEYFIKAYVTDFFEGKHNESWGVWHVYAWQKWASKEGLI